MKLRLLFALFAGFVIASDHDSVSADELSLVPEKSTIDFVGSKPEGKHKGGFKKFDSAAIANFDDPSRSTINIQFDAKSIWSDDEKLTNHLKSPDFFDVRKYPAITFESTEIVPGEGEEKTAKIKGDMQMLGKSVAIEVPIKATVTEETVEITAEFTIDRTKWGMTYGQGKIDNEVKITAKLHFKR
jgi:polyisoprenoid-binding protein YceI